MERYLVSKEGYAELERQLGKLRERYKQKLSERGEYFDRRDPRGFNDELYAFDQGLEDLSRQIRDREQILWNCQIHEKKERDIEKVEYRSIVEYRYLSKPEATEIVEIVDTREDAAGHRHVHRDTRFARALNGKKAGDTVNFIVGEKEHTIQICKLYPEWPNLELKDGS